MKHKLIRAAKSLLVFTLLLTLFPANVLLVNAESVAAPATLTLGQAINNGINVNGTHFPTKYLPDGLPVYCLDFYKTTPSNVTYTKGTKLDGRFVKLLNSFRSIPYSGQTKYYVEQISINWLQDRLDGVSDNQSGQLAKNFKNLNHTYVNLARKLTDSAMSSVPVANKITLKTSSGILTLREDGEYYESAAISAVPSGDGELISYRVSLNGAPKGTGIMTLDNKTSQTYLKGESFKIWVPADQITDDLSFKLNVTGTFENDVMYTYLPPNSTLQRVTPKKLYQETSTATSGLLTLKVDSADVGNLNVIKNDSEGSPIVGAEILITDPKGVANRYITDQNGKISLTDIEIGTYTVSEVNAPSGYLLNSEDYQVNVEKGETETVPIVDEEPVGRISVVKSDKEKSDGAQGDATLGGAVFEVRAKEDIYNASGSKLIYHADELVATLITRDDGNSNSVTVRGMGRYQIKEVSAPEGYLLNEEAYDVTIAYKDQNTKVIAEKVEVADQVMKRAFDLTKVSSESGDGEPVFLSNAEFTYILKQHVTEYGGFEKALEEAKKEESEISASEWGVMKTNEQGYAVSKEIPYGTYVVRETAVPEEHYAVDDFEVVIDRDDRTPISYQNIIDKKFSAKVQAVKYDKESGKQVLVEGAEFKIKALSDVVFSGKKFKKGSYIGYQGENEDAFIDSWKTDANGCVVIDKNIGVGEYELVEVHAPYGYQVNDESIRFKVSKNEVLEVDESGIPLISLRFDDEAVKGRFVIYKRGEVLNGVEQDDAGNLCFIYQLQALEGASYEVYAKEDIVDPSNDGTVLYQKDELITKIVTQKQEEKVEDGVDVYGITEELPLGKYYIREVEAPNGFILNEEEKEVALVSEDDTVAVVMESVTFHNERQKISIDLMKKDGKDGSALKGAMFGLYTKEEIKDLTGKEIVVANALVEKAESNSEGEVEFKADLPLGQYEIRELEAPAGYYGSAEVIVVDGSYQGQKVSVIPIKVEFKNEITKVEVSKTDITNGKELPGAKLTVYEKDDTKKVIDSWVSETKPHLIEGLETGKTYILEEISAPKGYEVAEKVEFTVEDNGKIQKVEMKDAPVKKTVKVETGDKTNRGLWISLFVCSVGLLTYLVVQKLEKKQKAES